MKANTIHALALATTFISIVKQIPSTKSKVLALKPKPKPNNQTQKPKEPRTFLSSTSQPKCETFWTLPKCDIKKKYMRIILLLCLSVRFFSVTSYAEEKKWAITGILAENYPMSWLHPSEYVLEDGYLYKGASHHIGQIYVHLGSVKIPADLLDKTVVAYGTLEKDLNQIIVRGEKAPANTEKKIASGEVQPMEPIRSDWVATETGFSIGRSTKRKLEDVWFLRVNRVEEFKGFTFARKDGQSQASFTNSFDHDLKDVKIVAHYESEGRPSPAYETLFSGPVAKGQTVSKVIPAATIDIEKRKYHLQSVQVKGRDENVMIMIDCKAWD
jgi:hypothetical protein